MAHVNRQYKVLQSCNQSLADIYICSRSEDMYMRKYNDTRMRRCEDVNIQMIWGCMDMMMWWLCGCETIRIWWYEDACEDGIACVTCHMCTYTLVTSQSSHSHSIRSWIAHHEMVYRSDTCGIFESHTGILVAIVVYWCTFRYITCLSERLDLSHRVAVYIYI